MVAEEGGSMHVLPAWSLVKEEWVERGGVGRVYMLRNKGEATA